MGLGSADQVFVRKPMTKLGSVLALLQRSSWLKLVMGGDTEITPVDMAEVCSSSARIT